MNILLTILGFAVTHVVAVFIVLVCGLSLIGIVVSETETRTRGANGFGRKKSSNTGN